MKAIKHSSLFLIFILVSFCMGFAEENVEGEGNKGYVVNITAVAGKAKEKAAGAVIAEEEIKKTKSEANTYNEKISDVSKDIINVRRQLDKISGKINIFIKNEKGIREDLIKNNKSIRLLLSKIDKNKKSITSLSNDNLLIKEKLKDTSNSINQVRRVTEGTIKEIREETKKVSKPFVTVSIIILAVVFLILVFIYMTTRKNILNVENKLSKIQKKYDEELSNLDIGITTKLEKILDSSKNSTKEIDHSLPLKVAEEINRMRTRISNMPDDTKGVKALIKATERLEEKLNDLGYEIVNLIGKPYTEGLTVQARIIPSEEIKKGGQVITRITKPQVNYNGVLVQTGDVEVSVGE